jgi:phosphate starvation-inducible PhoH-like protein|tara:strand:+ start:1097 stop:1819 length:723 start_codon:yes stop_codon:yes gene_type:complete
MARRNADSKSGSVERVAPIERKLHFRPRKFKFSAKQQNLLGKILDPDVRIVWLSGPAGSSKTYMSIYGFLKYMEEDLEYNILYVRSVAESADKALGSLPGDISDKFDPFLIPLEDKLTEILQPGDALELKRQQKVSAMPINFMRGAHWENMLVIADEAQNLTQKELTTLITRLGPNSKLIISGDFMQSDINGKSGFKKLFDLFNDEESKDEGIDCVTLTSEDIVRDPIIRFIVKKLEQLD